MTQIYPYRLFERTGIEIEHMLVDRATLDVLPVADGVIGALGDDAEEGDAALGEITLSNELVLHVVEIKSAEPAASLAALAGPMQDAVQRISAAARPLGGRLCPTGMHPWMDPIAEMRLWPHGNGPVYEAYNRIFDCRGHGWANLQSTHINLPFGDDDEFGRLHAAIRLVLPILPALAASSPFMDGRATGALDNRLSVYRTNSARVPSMAGAVIPEPVFTREDYERIILGRIYEELAPLDPDGILRHEWANSRGCIARFDRGAIEIRVLDTQECPLADLAVAAAVTAVVRALTTEAWSGLAEQQAWPIEALAAVFDACVRDAELAVIRDAGYLRSLGFAGKACTAAELWQHLIESVMTWSGEEAVWLGPLGLILREGTLARRILRATGANPDRARLREVYARLAECLKAGSLFRAT